jgi:Nuclease-related domain
VLIKAAEDKTKRIQLLESLQQSSQLDAKQKRWLRDELHRFKKGLQGERDSAFYLDSHFKDSPHHAVIHDLRLVFEGEVAQIDHLVFGRTGLVYLIETKNYSGNLIVNEAGEFTVDYDGDQYGIASPLEQSRRHERILQKLAEQLGIVGRVDKKLDVHHVVLMHPKAIIQRPPPKAFDTSFLIKADQFPSWHQKFADQLGVGSVLKGMLNLRSPETVREWAEKLCRQHRPQDWLALPDFMKPMAAPATKPAPAAPTATGSAEENLAKKRICVHCHAKISFEEGKFCWNNSKRFGGLQYCREHQALFQ